jgi:hypothetical protein
MAVTLEVSIPELVVNLEREQRRSRIPRPRLPMRVNEAQNSDQDFITLFGEEYAKVPDAKMARCRPSSTAPIARASSTAKALMRIISLHCEARLRRP